MQPTRQTLRRQPALFSVVNTPLIRDGFLFTSVALHRHFNVKELIKNVVKKVGQEQHG